ncbi:MAG: MarC family protein [Nitrospirae bacterium]|nr:MarC family protein [Nitrospirota bacterium]
MTELLKSLPNTFIPLFVAIGIFGILPIFISMTEHIPQSKKKAIARQSVITALVVSLAFTAVGEIIFGILGITVSDFKIAGGLVLLVFAILDFTRNERRAKFTKTPETVGVVPMGVPLIVGPAVLTTILVLIDHYGVLPTLTSLIINLIVVYLSLVGAQRIVRFLGKNGITALSKIMSLLLASIAVMMIRLGIETIIK